MVFRRGIVKCMCFLIVVVILYIITTTRRLTRSTQRHVSKNHIDEPSKHVIHHNITYDVCKTFDFNAAEWTLHWKKPFDETIENEKCQRLHDSIFDTKAVKWVVYPNGMIKNLGCTKSTLACKPSAHFDTNRKMRINTPPCCRAKMLKMLKVLTTGFQRLKIPHMLCGGAVIGWVRNEQIVPYDEDLDLFVDGKFWRTPEMMDFLKHMEEEYGYYIKWRAGLRWVAISHSVRNENGFGVWKYDVNDGKFYIHFPIGKQTYVASNLIPPRPANFSGIFTYMPNNPEGYLDAQYGKGRWKHEMDCKRIAGRKCVTSARKKTNTKNKTKTNKKNKTKTNKKNKNKTNKKNKNKTNKKRPKKTKSVIRRRNKRNKRRRTEADKTGP